MNTNVCALRHYRRMIPCVYSCAACKGILHHGATMTTATGSEAARRTIGVLLASLLGMQPLAPLMAGPNEQAVRMHNRLAGVPPSATVLQQMSTLISQGNPQGAAQVAMQNSGFYNTTLRNFIAPATN